MIECEVCGSVSRHVKVYSVYHSATGELLDEPAFCPAHAPSDEDAAAWREGEDIEPDDD